MTSGEMFGNAKWCGVDSNCASPYIRKTFNLEKTEKSVIRICGLGFFELYINGKKVSDDLLVPAFSQYEQRSYTGVYDLKDKLGARTYVMEYDVTGYLKKGKNALAVRLGRGWFDRGEGDWGTYGKIKLCFNLKAGEKEIISDESLRWKESDITYSDIYYGERVDASLEIKGFSTPELNDNDWHSVKILTFAETEYEIQTAPADKVIRRIKPVLVKDNGRYSVYDAKEAISGHAVVRSLIDGSEITVRYSDSLTENEELDLFSNNEKIQQEIFSNTKKGDLYEPHFCWHGFRYIELSDNAEIVSVNVVHSDCPVTSDFICDNEVLNWLYRAYIRTQLDNMHCAVPSDCPHLERLGYTGDGQLCCPAVMMMLDSREFYRKWMKDIADCQDKTNGHVQHTAPFMGGGGGPAGWGGAIVVVPYTFYKTYGEREILEEYYPNMLRYIEYCVSKCENGLLWHEERDWCLGDWCAPAENILPGDKIKARVLIPETFVNTALFVKHMEMVKEIAGILGIKDNIKRLNALIRKSKRSLEIAYYSPMTKDFCGNVQGANGFAVDIGIGEKETVISTCKKYESRKMFDTGIFATDIIPRILFENGYEQTAFDMLSSRGNISFGYMMEHDATTIWEDWHPERSLNHPMFGPVSRYLFEYILGIRQTKDGKAYENVVIEPKLVKGLKKAEGYITTVQGVFKVRYEVHECHVDFVYNVPTTVDFIVTVPETTKADFIFRGKKTPLEAGENRLNFVLS